MTKLCRSIVPSSRLPFTLSISLAYPHNCWRAVSLSSLFLLISLCNNGFGGVLLGLVITPLLWMLQVIGVRVGLESLAASIKTSENTARMLEIMQRQNP